jgi:hypothetical protein
MQAIKVSKWIRLSLASLLLVALLGVLMRYKIAFEFPYLDQKNLQHAHSHFAFAGWVTQVLMLLITHALSSSLSSSRIGRYRTLLVLNITSAVGMLVAFSMQGYGAWSITFSSISILIFAGFAVLAFADLNISRHIVQKNWFHAALFFGLLSTLGTAALVYMMVTKHIPQHSYLASVYWYLHFQYNGWFFFACMGLFIHLTGAMAGMPPPPIMVYRLFAYSCIPAYGLSILWLQLPIWIYALVVVASVAQFVAWLMLLAHLRKHLNLTKLVGNRLIQLLFIAVALCITVKFTLQLASVIPAISKLAFGFRPIVIAYLHLILLAIVSLYLLCHFYTGKFTNQSAGFRAGLGITATGIFLNELVLGIQGIASFSYTVIPLANELLLAAAIVIIAGIFSMLISNWKKLPVV